jgi:hypothetical protein
VGSSWTRFDGQGGQTLIPAGTIPGAAYNTDYTAVFSQARSYQAFPTATQFVNLIPDDNFFAGGTHTVSAGGGGGTSGGGGTGGGTGPGGFGGNLGK